MEALLSSETLRLRQYRVYAQAIDWFHVDVLAPDEAAALALAADLG